MPLKYANCVPVFLYMFHASEICQHNSCISLYVLFQRNTRIMLAYFSICSMRVKYANCVLVFLYMLYASEIREFCSIFRTFLHISTQRYSKRNTRTCVIPNKPFHGIFHHLESGHSSWNAHSDYMETAVKLFSQVYTAQIFQLNIWYYTSFYS